MKTVENQITCETYKEHYIGRPRRGNFKFTLLEGRINAF